MVVHSAVEVLTQITNVRTKAIFSTLSPDGNAYSEHKFGQDFRGAIVEGIDATGGRDIRAGARDLMASMEIAVTLFRLYGAGETYQTIWDEFSIKINTGDRLQLAFVEPDGVTKYIEGKIRHVDKEAVQDQFSGIRIPFTVGCPDPRFYRIGKPDSLISDTVGLFSDEGLFSDVDPDLIGITVASTSHIVSYDGTTDQTGMKIVLYGPLPLPVTIKNLTVINPVTGTPIQLVYNRAVAAGEHVTIDTGALDVTSTVIGNAFAFLIPGQEDWFTLTNGDNSVVVTTGSGTINGQVLLDWNPLDR